MSQLVKDLVKGGHLRTDSIIDAFSKIHRAEFVPTDLSAQAEADIPLPIGYGQTISQPFTVAFMLELLDPQLGQHILDVGSGSGWTTGLLAHIVGKGGSVTSMEVVKELCEFGKKNVDKFGFIKKGIVHFQCQSAEKGFAKNAPYDRILVSASAKEIPAALKEQLAIGGKIVMPIAGSIWCAEKKGTEEFHIEKFSGFAFVPFIKKD
jgi:protein-L-isoaspartate(D-aspartate) O-methyltransferase